MTWPNVPFGELCKLVNGKAYKPSDWSNKGLPIIRIQNLNDHEKTFNYWDGPLKNQVRVKNNDVLLAWSGTPGTSFGAHLWTRGDAVLNQHIFRVDLNNKVLSKRWAIFAVNKQLYKLIEQSHGGVGLQHVTKGMVESLEIPLPPLTEQKRIAAILDKADAIRRKRQAAIKLADDFLRTTFLDMFGDPVTNPKGVKVVPLSEITTRITDGVHQKPNYTETGVPFISVKDITTGVLKFDNCKFISLEDHQKYTKRCKAEKLDILYTKVGATYGRPALVDTGKEFSLYVSVCLIKPKKELVDPFYLKATMGTSAIKRQADQKIKGIGVPDLHLDQISQFLIPLPTMKDQREFARRVAAVENLKSSHESLLAESIELLNSLTQRAFRGEL